MKKTGMVCVTVMCLAMQGISSTPINPLPSEKMAAEIRKDPAKLKECIEWYMVYSPTGDHDLKQLRGLLVWMA
ncbi:MAG: hypothetical protein FWG50_09170 [Kiritimatiellaeota bacterium]|nr:hypothetical protein [Kiritimatiellota bacterium]